MRKYLGNWWESDIDVDDDFEGSYYKEYLTNPYYNRGSSYVTVGTSIGTSTIGVNKLTPEQEKQLAQWKKANLERNFGKANSYEEASKVASDTRKGIYFPGENGLYLCKILKIGGNELKTVDKVSSCGLFSTTSEGLKEINIVNKIPKDLLVEVIGSFNLVYKKTGNEAAAQIYRKKDGTYFIYYPEQRISKGQVSYPDDKEIPKLRVENELVLEMHSHNNMNAFWSSTDDANEQEPGMYIVLGTFNTDVTYKARAKYKSSQIELHLYNIFDITEEEEKDILKLANRPEGNDLIMNKIIKEPPVTQTRTYYASTYNPSYNRVKVCKHGATYNTFTKQEKEIENYINTESNKSVEGSVYTANTLEYVDRYSRLFNASVIENTLAYKYLMADCLYTDLQRLNKSTKTDGRNLGAETDPNYQVNLETQVAARVATIYALNAYITGNGIPFDMGLDGLYSDTGFKNIVKDITNTSLFAADYSLPVFWESLEQYEKAIIADAFYCNIIDVGTFVYDVTNTNYYFISFLMTLVQVGKEKREELREFINYCANYMMTNDSSFDADNPYGSIGSTEEFLRRAIELQMDGDGDSTSVATLNDIIMGEMTGLASYLGPAEEAGEEQDSEQGVQLSMFSEEEVDGSKESASV